MHRSVAVAFLLISATLLVVIAGAFVISTRLNHTIDRVDAVEVTIKCRSDDLDPTIRCKEIVK